MTDKTSGQYIGNFPSCAAAMYKVNVYFRAGASPAVTDVVVGWGQINWTGAAESVIELDVDAIKERTDNLPDDPADQSEVEAAITAAQSALKDEIDENEAKIDIIDTNVDTIVLNTGKVVNVYSSSGTSTKKQISTGSIVGFVEDP